MSKAKGFFNILIPSATVFFSSACIMIIELVAGRLIAKHLGSSLYTWTSIIGVVLAGITIGNYFGGRIADKYETKKTLSTLFGLASIATVTIIIFNNTIGNWEWMWYLNWPIRVFLHILFVFLLPSTLLGTISPVVAKRALDQGLSTGRTVGDIYAWGAAGSIAGTFLAGFYLIATLGTEAIMYSVAVALLVIGIFYRSRTFFLYLWALILFILVFISFTSNAKAANFGEIIGLREEKEPNLIYEDETQYCYVAVKQTSKNPDRRIFIQDKLKHSEINMDEIDNLLYFYTHIYASITHGIHPNPNALKTMIIGGGGYVYPQYLEKHWPGSHIDVVEIDPGVTKAAMTAFGLSKTTSINTVNMDARNYVDDMIRKIDSGKSIRKYDLIYEDAINDYSVPYQLVTKEFNDKIDRIIKDDGVYMVNLIEVYNSGLFLGSMIETLEKTFPYVSVLTEYAPHSIRNTFVLVASKKPVDLKKIIGDYSRGSDIWYLNSEEITHLKQQAHNIVMTDDYVPVENMLAPVVQRSSTDVLASRFKEKAFELKATGNFEKSIETFLKLIEIEPTLALLSYNEVGIMLTKNNKIEEAIDYFKKAINYNENAETKVNIAGIHLNLGLLYKKDKPSLSKFHIEKAKSGFIEELHKYPKSLKNNILVAQTQELLGNFSEAAKVYQTIINLNPYQSTYHLKLAQCYEKKHDYNLAIKTLQKSIAFFKHIKQEQKTNSLKEYLNTLIFRQSQSNSEK